jgi:hypothetical protein
MMFAHYSSPAKATVNKRRACGEGKRLVRVDEVQQTPLPKTKKKQNKEKEKGEGCKRTNKQIKQRIDDDYDTIT